MLYVSRDALGNLRGCAEVQIVNDRGTLDPNGTYLWIEQLEVSKGENGKECILDLMTRYTTYYPTLRWAYWVRRLKTGPKIHGPYSRSQIERFMGGRLCGLYSG
jgi:hypothetical protein